MYKATCGVLLAYSIYLLYIVVFSSPLINAECKVPSFTVTSFALNEDKSSFGAEVRGLRLEDISDESFMLVYHYLLQHKVLVFRDQQDLSVEGQRLFTQRFGPLQVHIESTSHHPHYNDVNVISNLRNGTGDPIGLYGDHVENYHTDLSWSALPNLVTVLKTEILPSSGGDTHFVDSTTAYAALPDELKDRIRGKKGLYTYLKFRDDVPGVSEEALAKLRLGTEHPLVSVHPDTASSNLFANAAHTVSVLGVSKEESDEILSQLNRHIENPRFLYVHRWREGDVLIWDNRAVQHRASQSPSTARKLVRTTVQGREPPRETLDEVEHREFLIQSIEPCAPQPLENEL